MTPKLSFTFSPGYQIKSADFVNIQCTPGFIRLNMGYVRIENGKDELIITDGFIVTEDQAREFLKILQGALNRSLSGQQHQVSH